MLLLQEAWTAPSLRMVCDQLAGAWAIAEAVTTLLSLVGVCLEVVGGQHAPVLCIDGIMIRAVPDPEVM
jgi:hypothetical protein